MRHLLIVLAAAALLAVSTRSVALAADVPADRSSAITSQAEEIDDNDDTRVEVQLVVLGIAIGTVFVLGTGAYLVRRRLGLVPPPPEPGGDGHH